MRLFVAVELPDEIRARAGKAAERVAEGLGPGARRAVTWVAPDKMHLTVRFLGEVEEPLVEELRERLSRPFATRPFRLVVAGLGAFPPSGPPRVIWLGLGEGADRLSGLHHEIEARLDGLGFEKEDRPFRAHLTLGRVKGPLGPAARAVLAATPAAVGECEVSKVTLFQSRLSPRGATYTPLAYGELAR